MQSTMNSAMQLLTQASPTVTPTEANSTTWIPDHGSSLSLDAMIQNGLNVALIAVGIVATAFLIWAGIKYIMAGSDSGKAKEAQDGIKNAIIGTVIALAAVVIVTFVYDLLNVPFVQDIDEAIDEDSATEEQQESSLPSVELPFTVS